MGTERVIEIERQGFRLRAVGDESRIAIAVHCGGPGGGLVTVPTRLRGKLADGLEALAKELRRWDEAV